MFFNVQPYSSGGFVASAVVKAYPGRVHWFFPYNQNAGTRYAMLFDATALPPNGTAPLWEVPISANSAPAKELGFPPDGLLMQNGIVVALSSTVGTLTIAAADLQFTLGWS